MVLRMPRWTTRDMLLVGFFAVWSALMLVQTVKTGDWPDEKMWGVLATGLGGIVLLFRPDKPGGPGSGESGAEDRQ